MVAYLFVHVVIVIVITIVVNVDKAPPIIFSSFYTNVHVHSQVFMRWWWWWWTTRRYAHST